MSRLGPYGTIVLAGVLLALLPVLFTSGTVQNFLIFTLIVALAAQGWNLLGGYGGQFSFGHASFFGTGAYTIAVLQERAGFNAWAALPIAIALGALVGAVIGTLAFRARLRGSYFALVTLAFAEVFRIVANVLPVTGGAAAPQRFGRGYSRNSRSLRLLEGCFSFLRAFASIWRMRSRVTLK